MCNCVCIHYGLDGPGNRNPVGVRFSAPIQNSPVFHSASHTISTWSLSWGPKGWGMALISHPI